jgi:hypothetical protein
MNWIIQVQIFARYCTSFWFLILVEELDCSGPSPLTAAFLLALGGLYEGAGIF